MLLFVQDYGKKVFHFINLVDYYNTTYFEVYNDHNNETIINGPLYVIDTKFVEKDSIDVCLCFSNINKTDLQNVIDARKYYVQYMKNKSII